MDFNTIDQIYKTLVRNLGVSNIDVFLCGGADASKHIRNKLRSRLKAENDIAVLYPEDLFADFISSKKYDLLTLEKYLADNSDVIVIVAESEGSYAELGAFVNNDYTVDKVVVLQKTKYKYSNSFITKGPVEFIKRRDDNRVLYYNSDLFSLGNDLIDYLRNRYVSNKLTLNNRKKDINSITGIMYTFLFILYFYEIVDIYEMKNAIKNLYETSTSSEKIYTTKYFNAIFNAAYNRLINEKKIAVSYNDNKRYYALTDEGNTYILNCIKNIDLSYKEYKINGIRLSAIREQYY